MFCVLWPFFVPTDFVAMRFYVLCWSSLSSLPLPFRNGFWIFHAALLRIEGEINLKDFHLVLAFVSFCFVLDFYSAYFIVKVLFLPVVFLLSSSFVDDVSQ